MGWERCLIHWAVTLPTHQGNVCWPKTPPQLPSLTALLRPPLGAAEDLAGRNEVPDEVHCTSNDPSKSATGKNNVPLDKKQVTEGNTIFSVPGTQYWPGLASTTTTVRITESLSQIKNPVTYLPKNREMGRWKEQQIPRLQNKSSRLEQRHYQC